MRVNKVIFKKFIVFRFQYFDITDIFTFFARFYIAKIKTFL